MRRKALPSHLGDIGARHGILLKARPRAELLKPQCPHWCFKACEALDKHRLDCSELSGHTDGIALHEQEGLASAAAAASLLCVGRRMCCTPVSSRLYSTCSLLIEPS